MKTPMTTLRTVLVATCATGLLALLPIGAAQAADHQDAPATMASPEADLNDLYAWMSDDGSMVNLVMTFHPAATTDTQFSDSVQYVFHVASKSGFFEADAGMLDIICTFEADQTVQCWAGEMAYVTGDASDPSGVANDAGTLRVFSGLRDDPFFFNLEGFEATIAAVGAAAGDLTFDDAGCPDVNAETSAALVEQLMSAPDGGPAMDFFAPLNTLALVVQVDADLVTSGGPILGVWASTRAAGQ